MSREASGSDQHWCRASMSREELEKWLSFLKESGLIVDFTVGGDGAFTFTSNPDTQIPEGVVTVVQTSE